MPRLTPLDPRHILTRQMEYPDGLLIADDNLVEHAQMGIVDSGVRVGQELHLVIHANFPSAGPNVLPARRLGYDARTALSACLELLEEVRQGKPAGVRVVPAVFEDELSGEEPGVRR